MTWGIGQTRKQLMLALAALALSVRVLIPTGWMPSVEAGRPTITLCTGSGMAEAWIDADGKIHKSSPGKVDNSSGFCAFSTFVFAVDSLAAGFLVAMAFGRVPGLRFDGQMVAIGRGLAAPPPPARGPPNLI
jgi:hypothetical protein